MFDGPKSTGINNNPHGSGIGFFVISSYPDLRLTNNKLRSYPYIKFSLVNKFNNRNVTKFSTTTRDNKSWYGIYKIVEETYQLLLRNLQRRT